MESLVLEAAVEPALIELPFGTYWKNHWLTRLPRLRIGRTTLLREMPVRRVQEACG